MTGCTFGKGNFIFKDYGKQVYTFIRRSDGEAIRISIDWEPGPEPPEANEAWDKFSKGDRSPEVMKIVGKRKKDRTTTARKASQRAIIEEALENFFNQKNIQQ